MRVQGGGGPNSTARTLMGAANRCGVPSVMAELGGGGAVTPDILARTERGLRRILHEFGVLPGYVSDETQGTRELRALGSLYAYETGLFVPARDVGDAVAKGEEIGQIEHPETPMQAPTPVNSPHDGVIMAVRALARVEAGDALFQIGADVA